MSKTVDRSQRRRRLLDLLESGIAATQDEIVDRLAADGHPATQATISRDLAAVGAVRRHQGDRTIYALPDRNTPPDAVVARLLPDLVRHVEHSGTMIVVRTFPGMASSLAAALDAAPPPGLIGTIAGDDTVFAVAGRSTTGAKLAAAIRDLAKEDA